MKRLLFVLLVWPLLAHGQTLEECQQAAEQNYPLIRQYGLIEKMTELEVDNLDKGWLPQVSATAQGSYQSDVMSWPDQMQTMMKGMGVDLVGLKKDQYRVGIDVQQTVLDEIDDKEYLSVLRPLLKQKSKSIRAESDYERNQKLVRFALGRGFTFDIIRLCLDTSEINEDEFEQDED